MDSIYLSFEKERNFSTTDLYSILDSAVKISVVDGYINSFVCTRAALLLLASVEYPERQEEILEKINNDGVLDAWDFYLEDGIIETLLLESKVVNNISNMLETWCDEYSDYLLSTNVGSNILSQSINNDLISQLYSETTQSGVAQAIEIADRWGMNNANAAPQKEAKILTPFANTDKDESVFKE